MSRLHERAEQDPIQVARRDEVLAEGFLDDDAGPFRAPRLRQLFHDGSEERGRDRQVVRRVLGAAELAPERLEGRRVFVVPVDVAKQSAQLGERGTVQAAVLLDAVLRPRAQLVEGPAGLGHADDRHVEVRRAWPSPAARERSSCTPDRPSPRRTRARRSVCRPSPSPCLTPSLRGRLSPRVRRTESASPRAAGSGSPLLRAS